MTAGVLLRALLIVFPRDTDDDTDAYLELGRNLLHRFTYGFLGDNGVVSPALFRLPGYPIFLALLGGHMQLVFIVQCGLDLAACYMLALCLRRCCGERAGLAALALSTTCLFTATYAACALTESLSIFAVAAAIYTLGNVVNSAGGRTRLVPLAACAALAMLLRPDGALLTFAIAAALLFYRRAAPVAALRSASLFVLLACLPLVPWTIRNAVTFHVFQPLAPRHVNDPGERVNYGFYRWLRTWAVDFDTTVRVFWKVGAEPIDIANLPPRAFDSPAQRAQTVELFAVYNRTNDVNQALDDRFAALAATRIHAHPLRYSLWIPALRVTDMWLRPRTEGIPVNSAWWLWREHPRQSAAALALALLNLFYVIAAIGGAFRKPPLAVFLATYFLLRCLLLATMENSEPRYTLEAYPILFVLAAVFFARRTTSGTPLPPM